MYRYRAYIKWRAGLWSRFSGHSAIWLNGKLWVFIYGTYRRKVHFDTGRAFIRWQGRRVYCKVRVLAKTG